MISNAISLCEEIMQSAYQKGSFCQCMRRWLSLNIITRTKGRCIKHCNITHLVIGLFKQVWPSKPVGEVRRSKQAWKVYI